MLGDELLGKWTTNEYYYHLSIDDNNEEIKRKMFTSSMKVTYGITREYS